MTTSIQELLKWSVNNYMVLILIDMTLAENVNNKDSGQMMLHVEVMKLIFQNVHIKNQEFITVIIDMNVCMFIVKEQDHNIQE